MIQCFWGVCHSFGTTFQLGTFPSIYNGAFYNGTGVGAYGEISAPVSVAGTFKNLAMSMVTTPPVGFTLVLRLYVNGVATDLATQCVNGQIYEADTFDDIHVNVGDTIAMFAAETGNLGSTGNLGVVRWSIEFHSDNATECLYGVVKGLPTVDGTSTGVFSGHEDWDADPTTGWNVVDTPGTLTRMDVLLDAAPGVGKSKELAIWKNGVKQDGSGGTANTVVTVSDAAVSGTSTFSLALVPDDYLWTQVEHTNSPASSRIGLGFKFISTNDYDFPICGQDTALGQGGGLLTLPPTAIQENIGDVSEANMVAPGPITPMWLTGIRTRFSTAPGGSTSRTLTARRNFDAPVGTPTIEIAGSSVYGSAVGLLALTATDFWSLGYVNNNSPGDANVTWAFTGTTLIDEEDEPEIGLFDCPHASYYRTTIDMAGHYVRTTRGAKGSVTPITEKAGGYMRTLPAGRGSYKRTARDVTGSF